MKATVTLASGSSARRGQGFLQKRQGLRDLLARFHQHPKGDLAVLPMSLCQDTHPKAAVFALQSGQELFERVGEHQAPPR